MDTEYSWKIAYYYFWFKVFASRSLLEVRPIPSIYGVPPTVPLPIAASLVKYAKQKCSSLNTLGLFNRGDPLSRFDHDLEHPVFEENQEPLARVLADAQILVNISGSPILFDVNTFATLGHLPMLARLAVFYSIDLGYEEQSPLVLAWQAENAAFLLLRHFAVHNVLRETIYYIQKVPPLLRRLTSLEIIFLYDLAPDGEPWIQEHFISMLCESSPQLTHLAISFRATPDESLNQPFTLNLTEENLVMLSAFPLTDLNIGKTMIESNEAVKALAAAWPRMESLKLPAKLVRLQNLHHFARYMPHLRHLAVDMDMVPPFEHLDLGGAAAFKQLALHILESRFYGIS